MTPSLRTLAWFSLLALSLNASVRAERLANIGPTYPIAEKSLLAFIHERLAEKQRTGELAMLEEKIRQPQHGSGSQPTPGSRP